MPRDPCSVASAGTEGFGDSLAREARVGRPASRPEAPHAPLTLPRPELFDRSHLEAKFPFLNGLLLPGESLGAMFQRLTGKPLIITIDGPGAVGKNTVGEKHALYFGVPFFSSGITYRVPALVALSEIPEFKEKGWVERRRKQDSLVKGADGKVEGGSEPLTKGERRKLHQLVLDLVGGQLRVENRPEGQRVIVERGEKSWDVTDEVYVNPECSTGASILGEIGIIRRDLLPFQRSFGEQGCVTDGRDMGTTVFPEAPVKFYFGGAPEMRALWRLDQRLHKEGKGHLIPTKLESDEDLANALAYIDAFYKEAEDIESRDRHDKTRRHSPLREPEGAIRFFPAEYVYANGKLRGERPIEMRSYSEQETFEATRDLALARIETLLRAHGTGI